jgi:hypothetical protein
MYAVLLFREEYLEIGAQNQHNLCGLLYKLLKRKYLEVVEAVGVEPTSETTVNREHSCFSNVHLCLVIDA